MWRLLSGFTTQVAGLLDKFCDNFMENDMYDMRERR